MTNDAKRWQFLLAGNVEVSHLYDEEGNMYGIRLRCDFEAAECSSPAEVNAVVDRWLITSLFTGSIH
jgi:hypothetical protein